MKKAKKDFQHPLVNADNSDSDNGRGNDMESDTENPARDTRFAAHSADPRFSRSSKLFDTETKDDDLSADDGSEEEADRDDEKSGDSEMDDGDDVHGESDVDGDSDVQANDNNYTNPDDMTAHKPSAKKPITIEALKSFSDALNNTGLVYISRLPPFMSPAKLRQLLAKHGRLGRLYAAPEDAKTAYRRKKYRGNKRVNYTEAWVEFEDKKVARRTAEALNLRPMGEKKRDRFYDDLWNIKYLPRFKWHHLTDQIAYERAVRDQKLRAETEQVKRETKAYIKNVERGKMIEAMEEKRKRKREAEAEGGDNSVSAPLSSAPESTAKSSAFGAAERKFRQREVKVNDNKTKNGLKSASKARVLAKIFG